MPKVRDSKYWQPLLERYPRSPSIALCRIPEVEFLGSLQLQHPVLDHCCGDGYVAALCFPGVKMDFGADMNETSLQVARCRGNYVQLLTNDLGRRIGLESGSVNTVFNNSGIEHIPDLNGALAEISRILRPGGMAYFNVLNKRYFDWWPEGRSALEAYREYQPFHHALDEATWTDALHRHGFVDVEFRDYFPRRTAELLAQYDYRYSAFYLRRRPSVAVAVSAIAPAAMLRQRWDSTFGELEWTAPPGQGAGFMIEARRAS